MSLAGWQACQSLQSIQFAYTYLLKVTSLQLIIGLCLGLIARSGCASDSILTIAPSRSLASLLFTTSTCLRQVFHFRNSIS